jgi:hypothetical protein
MLPAFATFVLPALALGAAATAAAVPVLIHLLSRQRHRVVPWAAIRFLLAAQKRHRRRVDRWLLLAARVIALLLPLAAMCATMPWAERVWQWISPGPLEVVSNLPRTHHVVVVDASLSMTANADGETRFARGVRAAEDLVRTAGAGDGFSLIVLGSGTVPVVPGPSVDRDKVLAEIAALKPTHGPCDYPSALTAVADTLARSPRNYPRRQVTLISDCQRSGWSPVLAAPPAAPPDVWKRILPRADVAVIDVAGTDLPNLSVAAVALADPLAMIDAPNAVVATVRNHSSAARRGVRVELLIARPSAAGTDTTLAAVKDVTLDVIDASKATTVTFPLEDALKFRDAGLHLLQVRLTGGDDLPADDTRTLAVTVRNAIPVLVVNGRTGPTPADRNGEDVLTALDPPGPRVAGNPFRATAVGPTEFAEPTLSDLSAVDCAVLCDPATITPSQVARLELLLKRGGGVIIVLGPNAAANRDTYNRVLFDDGNGLLPGKLLGVKESRGAGEADYRLFAEDKAFERDPLAAFRVGNARAALTDVPFQKYVVMDAPADGRARRVLSFVPANPAKSRPDQAAEKPAPAVVEWARHRGRVAVVTTALTKEWGEWPSSRSFLPFVQELARYLCTSPDRHTLRVGEAIEDGYPPVSVGQSALVFTPDGRTDTVPLVAGDDIALLRYADTAISGLYKVRFGDRKDGLFAVNVPESAAGGGESDLARVSADTLRALGPTVQVVNELGELKFASADGETVLSAPKPRGPTVARWLLTAALLFLALELWLAWRVGPSRASGGLSVADQTVATGRPWVRWVWTGVGMVPLLIAALLLAAVAHAEATGRPLGFLPDAGRAAVESALGVPSAGPGEGTRWRVESAAVYAAKPRTDARILVALVAAVAVVVVGLYWLERRAAGKIGRLVVPAGLRLAAVLLLGFVMLPQLKLAFDREGWPDVAVVLDTSASMSTVDDLRDPAVRAKAEELAAVGGGAADRLALAKVLLTRPGTGWLDKLIREKQVKVHVFSLADQAKLAGTVAETTEVPDGAAAVNALVADGPTSRLGDGVQAVLKGFRGGSLAAVIAFTDGQTTVGEELTAAGRAAARQGVPLYLVGFGESRENPDLELSDLRADDVVYKGDRLVFEARLTARGPNPPTAVPVILSERQGETLVERARVTVTPDAGGKPVPVTLPVTPTDAGEKSFVIDVPPLPGEVETGNNRLEKVVLVTDSRKLRVLYVEGYARYEYRFVKAQLEREVDAAKGTPVELGVILQDASPFFQKLDKSVLEAFPTKAQLFEYDAVVLGDIDPAKLERANTFFADLVEFVKVKGGGLLVIAGEHHIPHKLFDTPLAGLLPVAPTDAAARGGPPAPTPETAPLTDGYHLKLTPLGRSHPLFRFDGEGDGGKRLDALQPFFWAASGYKRKPTAEVLATHPERPADGDPGALHPLAVQQFYGRGRVLFFGFDETWRWRFRLDEERFNRFWTQTVRALSRTRVTTVELKTDRQTAYRKGEPIRVTLRYPDDAPAPPDGATVRLRMQRQPLRLPGGGILGETETTVLDLTKIADTRGEYQALVTRTPEGEYLFQVAEGVELPGGTRPRAEARVLPPPGERDRPEMNRPELERAANESRGQFYTLADADKLIGDLPEVTRLPLNQPVSPLGVWNHAALFGLLVLLFAVEWWVRRRERLV